MAYLKHFLVTLFFGVIVLNSCQSDMENTQDINPNNNQERIALQTIFSGMTNESYNDVSSNYSADSLCFQFVYSIQLTYNTQNNITVNNFNGLIEVINNQSSQLYITGIVTPFQIIMNGQTQTINTVAEMVTLIDSCDYFSFNETIENSFCFDIIFPIYITSETGQNVAINNIQDFLTFLNTQTNTYQAEIVFPINVIYNGNTMTIHNLYEFIELTYSCNENGCACYEIYSPVCVQTPTGIVEYGNMCYAACAGYTQNDIVPCNNGGDCSIFNLTFTVGDCGTNDTFSLTLDFDYNNPQDDEFEVYARDSVAGAPAFWDYKGVYPLSQLPINIQNVSDAETPYQSVKVQIKDHPDCFLIDGFESPNCGGDPCNANAEVITEPDFSNINTSNYTITNVSLNGDCLEITVSSSGCDPNDWQMNLYSTNAFYTIYPYQRAVKVELINNQDCTAVFQKNKSFNLIPFRIEGQNQVPLNIIGWSGQIVYVY